MPLAANALVSLEEVKSWLGIKDPADDLKLADEINRATIAIEAYCNRPLKQATYTSQRLCGPDSQVLYLKAVPVNADTPVTVSVNESTQTIWLKESDGDPAGFDVILASTDPTDIIGTRDHLFRSRGWAPTSSKHPYNILLTYTGGFATAPDDLKEACIHIVHKLWRDRQRQIPDVQTVTLPSGAINLLDIGLPRLALLLLGRYRIGSVAGI